MANLTIKGTPSIVWGSSNTLGAPAGAIVESLRLTPKNGSPIADIEDNNGASANLVLLADGFHGKISALYDNAKTWPTEGANVAITIPYLGANANAVPFGQGAAAKYANNAITYYCTLTSIEPSFARKKEETIDLNLEYRPNVTP